MYICFKEMLCMCVGVLDFFTDIITLTSLLNKNF